MRRPRVMHIIGCLDPYGSERSMLNVCLSLRDRYTPSVLAFRGGAMETMLRAHEIPFATLAPDGERNPSVWSRFWFCMNNIRRYRPDIVHTHYEYGNTLGRIAAHLLGIPTVAHVRGTERLCGTLLYRIAYRVAHVGQTRLVTVSGGLADKMRLATGLDSITIYNAVDENVILNASNPRKEMCVALGIAPDSFVIGTVGRVEHVKDYPTLLRCAARVCAMTDQAHFVCVGDGSLFSEMQQLRDRLGLQDRVHFLGFREDVGAILNSLHVFAITSLGEGFPRSVVEAMWAGLPIVGTRVIGTEETIVDGQQGFLVPAGDDAAMAERILQLYHDPKLREQMGQQAYERVRDKFSLDALARSIDALYRELLGMD
ncbi:MAG: glycosyltransferase [Armatimonadetes bacterium]|nr:glycosyltransferase [Armatimonadota bacterium]